MRLRTSTLNAICLIDDDLQKFFSATCVVPEERIRWFFGGNDSFRETINGSAPMSPYRWLAGDDELYGE